MNRKFGYESKEMYQGFFEALEGRENQYAREDDLHSVMEQIQNFLDACYMMGVNPLRELRRILPQYLWQFHVLKDKGQIRRVISNSDLVWRVNWDMDMPGEYSERIEFVTATNQNRAAPERASHVWVDVRYDGIGLEQNISFALVHDGCPAYHEREGQS